jgi:hypothetical protein
MFQHASDDQIALTICFGAVLVSGAVMYFSAYIGELTRKVKVGDPETQSRLTARGAAIRQRTEREIHEKAA